MSDNSRPSSRSLAHDAVVLKKLARDIADGYLEAKDEIESLRKQLDEAKSDAHKWAVKYGSLRGKIQSALIIVDEDRHLKQKESP